MITQAEALQTFEDLKESAALRANRVFANRFLPELRRLAAEARAGMRDRTLPPAERCEHVTAWEIVTGLSEFLDKEEARMRAALQEHDAAASIIERPFT